MNIRIKTLGKLSVVVFIMMVLSSCSSMSNMNAMPKAAAHHVHVTKQSHHQPKPQHKKHIKPRVATPVMPSAPTEVMQPMVPGYVNKPIQITPAATQNEPKPQAVKKLSVPVTAANPVVGDMCLLNVHSIKFDPRRYQRIEGHDVVKNVNRLDAIGGNYHYIQAARWDNGHIDQTYITARTAQLMSLIGLGLLEVGYVDSNTGFTMMVFAGNGHIMDLPGSKVEMIVIRAKTAPQKMNKTIKTPKPAQKKIKSASVKKMIKARVVEFDRNDFYISGTDVIKITSGSTMHAQKEVVKKHSVHQPRVVRHQAKSPSHPSWSAKHQESRKYCDMVTAVNLTYLEPLT